MKRASRLLLVLPLLPLLAACVRAPARTEPDISVTPPQDWTAAESPRGTVDDDWWTSFEDPQLNVLVPLALEGNRDLHAAAARLEQSAALARIAGADLKPQLGVGVGATRRKQNFIGFGDLVPGSGDEVLSTTYSQFNGSLDITWEIDLWGRLRASARAALADFEASEADYQGARLSVAGQTARLWFALAEAQQQVDLARSSAASFRSSADWIRARFERGVRPAIDLRLALSNLAAAESELARRRRQVDALLRQLEVLLGDYPSARLFEEHPASALPGTPPPVPAGLPAELIGRRPDLFSAERRLVAADQRLLSARRSLYPRLSLTGSAGTATAELGDLVNGDFSVWSLVGNLTQPIFQGGRLRANIDRAAGGSEEALAVYAGTALQAYAEVETALAAEAFLRAQERALEEAATQLVAAERLAEERYRYGVGDYLTVLDSQTRSFISRSNLLTLRRARLQNRIDLYLALGGGFDAETRDVAADAEPREEEEESSL